MHFGMFIIQLSTVEYFYYHLSIDVSELLLPKVYYFDFIQSLPSSITSIILPNWTCNDIDYTRFDFSRFTHVESIKIGDDCFASVKTFKIDGLNRLKTVIIGSNSFTHKKNNLGNDDKSKSLESIQIGEYSFSDFGGDFELKNLPQLQSIQIGIIGNCSSNNFSSNSFVVRGIDMMLSMYNA